MRLFTNKAVGEWEEFPQAWIGYGNMLVEKKPVGEYFFLQLPILKYAVNPRWQVAGWYRLSYSWSCWWGYSTRSGWQWVWIGEEA